MWWVYIGLTLTSADIPVNCNYLEILGNWEFHVSGDTHEASLYNPETDCGHGQPDHVVPIIEGEMWSLPNEQLVTIAVEEPNVARSEDWGLGHWTM